MQFCNLVRRFVDTFNSSLSFITIKKLPVCHHSFHSEVPLLPRITILTSCIQAWFNDRTSQGSLSCHFQLYYISFPKKSYNVSQASKLTLRSMSATTQEINMQLHPSLCCSTQQCRPPRSTCTQTSVLPGFVQPTCSDLPPIVSISKNPVLLFEPVP